MKKLLLLFGVLTMGSTLTYAQDYGITYAREYEFKVDIEDGFTLSYFDGTPFFADRWQDGVVTWNNGNQREYQMNLYLIDERFFVRIGDGIDSVIIVDFSADIASITLGQHKFIQINYQGSPKIMEELYNGKSILLKHYTVSIPEKRRQETLIYSSVNEIRLKFIHSDTLYYAIDDGYLDVLPTSKSKLYAIFGDKADVIKKYIKENKLKIKREDDLKKIFEYYDSL